MQSTESRRSRRIVGTITGGADLFDGLRAACAQHHVRSGELRATGVLIAAELSSFDVAARRSRPPHQLAGGLELVSLVGSVCEQRGQAAIRARATLLCERDTGAEVVGGELVAATAHAVEFVIEAFDDVVIERAAHAELGVEAWHRAVAIQSDVEPATRSRVPVAVERERTTPAAVVPPAATPLRQMPSSSSAPASATWADVAAASGSGPTRPDAEHEHEDVLLAAGDVILHPRFKRCVVHRVEGAGEFVQVQLKNGRIVRLSLEVMRLAPGGVENGQRIFTATIL